MYLYHLTLQVPTQIPSTAVGCFSAEGRQEVVVVRGPSQIELFRLDPTTGRLNSIGVQNLFCIVREIAPFRLPGDNCDYLVLGTDSGRLVILMWREREGGWARIHMETFGRSGVRRTTAGQYVASDPRGRAIMIAAIERQKLVYVMNRDPATRQLTISSPLEANKSNLILFALVAVDVGYENPLFAALEVDTTLAVNGEQSVSKDLEKILTFYEVDLGLNHVTRKWSEIVIRTSNFLLPIPGGEDGPGGLLVCAEGIIAWHRLGFNSVSAIIPQRLDSLSTAPKRKTIINTGSIVRTKTGHFALLQSEEGDLLKVVLESDEKGLVVGMMISYFDSIPVATDMVVFRSGFLFMAGEWSTHRLYQIQSLGDDNNNSTNHRQLIESERMKFTPRELSNLVLVDQLENYGEIIDGRVLNLGGEETTQLYSLQGRAHHSSFNIMRQGIHVTEVAASELPAIPTGVWTLKEKSLDIEDAYIVVSFDDSTVVLKVGETVEEATDSGILTNVATLALGQLNDGSFVQVHSRGVRQVRPDRRINEWKTSGSPIVLAVVNTRQVIVALADHRLVYFETDLTGILLEERTLAALSEEVTALALGPVPEGRQRSRFFALGSADMTVRILSCDPEECLEPLSLQALAAKPKSLLISDLGGGGKESQHLFGSLVLDVGLENGVHARLRLDGTSGTLTDPRIRYLGTKPVQLCRGATEVAGSVILALSSRPWLGCMIHGQSHLLPLAHEFISMAAPFASAQCPAGFVALSGALLRILMVESVGDRFTRHCIQLEQTPRKLAFHPASNLFAIIESDHRSYSPSQRNLIENSWGLKESSKDNSDNNKNDWTHLSYVGKWDASVRLINPMNDKTTTAIHHFENNEALTCVSFVTFHDRLNELYLAVGMAIDMSICPRSATSSAILLFRVDPSKGSLTLTHRTPVDGIPSTLTSFGGRLLAGVGSALRLYDIGMRQLLRKCETRLPTFATALASQGWRVFVGDSASSILLLQYHPTDNRFQLVADDTQQRPITALLPLDYDTVAVSDRFGSFSVLRLPASVAEDLENESTAGAIAAKREHLFGAPFKLERLVEFYLGDTITSISKATLAYGSRELLLYTTISGGVGIFMPFTSRDEALLFQNLEMTLRGETPAGLAGRDHLIFRSHYAPVKAVIDGDLCETFYNLGGDRMHFVAQGLDRSPIDLLKRIQDMRVTAGV